MLSSKAEQLIDLINNYDYWEIIDVQTTIMISIIHMVYKKSHQKNYIMHVALMPNVTFKLSQTEVYRCVA